VIPFDERKRMDSRKQPRAGATLGIYAQVPFCQTKCTYCNFQTGPFSRALYAPYVDAICREIVDAAALYGSDRRGLIEPLRGLVADTVYVGGGTPSLLEPESLARILDAVRATFTTALSEVTLEADPETIGPQKAKAWRDAGFNRISLGAQSFHDKELIAAGRKHRVADIPRADALLRQAGFSNLSYDLIIGLPHQTPGSWEESLERLFGLQPEHVSIYMLEVDERSRLGREILSAGLRYGAAKVPSEDQMADCYERARRSLAGAGYRHYEISNWTRPGRESQHNLKYWRRKPYLGIGAGAHSFNGQERWANVHDPATYMASVERSCLAIEQRELLTTEQVLHEKCFLGLRQTDGLNLDDVDAAPRERMRPQIDRLLAAGLVRMRGGCLQILPERLSVANEVIVQLLS
jgi:oxygen-independent coproporphyrinogen-3 oxidase